VTEPPGHATVGGEVDPITPAPPGASLAPSDAVVAAKSRAGDELTPLEVEVDQTGVDPFVVSFYGPDVRRDYRVDPQTGEILSEESESLEADEAAEAAAVIEVLARGTVTLHRAAELAEANYEAEELHEIELEIHDGKLVLEVETHGEIDLVTWHLDPQTGEVLGREDGDDVPIRRTTP
jgi:uncharacterized membrane protein YkoI